MMSDPGIFVIILRPKKLETILLIKANYNIIIISIDS